MILVVCLVLGCNRPVASGLVINANEATSLALQEMQRHGYATNNYATDGSPSFFDGTWNVWLRPGSGFVDRGGEDLLVRVSTNGAVVRFLFAH